jgi:hypothetical protein
MVHIMLVRMDHRDAELRELDDTLRVAAGTS